MFHRFKHRFQYRLPWLFLSFGFLGVSIIVIGGAEVRASICTGLFETTISPSSRPLVDLSSGEVMSFIQRNKKVVEISPEGIALIVHSGEGISGSAFYDQSTVSGNQVVRQLRAESGGIASKSSIRSVLILEMTPLQRRVVNHSQIFKYIQNLEEGYFSEASRTRLPWGVAREIYSQVVEAPKQTRKAIEDHLENELQKRLVGVRDSVKDLVESYFDSKVMTFVQEEAPLSTQKAQVLGAYFSLENYRGIVDAIASYLLDYRVLKSTYSTGIDPHRGASLDRSLHLSKSHEAEKVLRQSYDRVNTAIKQFTEELGVTVPALLGLQIREYMDLNLILTQVVQEGFFQWKDRDLNLSPGIQISERLILPHDSI